MKLQQPCPKCGWVLHADQLICPQCWSREKQRGVDKLGKPARKEKYRVWYESLRKKKGG